MVQTKLRKEMDTGTAPKALRRMSEQPDPKGNAQLKPLPNKKGQPKGQPLKYSNSEITLPTSEIKTISPSAL